MYTFVTGGYRSGRSNYALRRAAELGQPPWLYVSTRQETDEAVRKRIERHRRDAEAIWRTAVMPPKLSDLLAPAALDGCGAAVFDGIAGWIETRLAGTTAAGDGKVFDGGGAVAEKAYRQPGAIGGGGPGEGPRLPPPHGKDQPVLRA